MVIRRTLARFFLGEANRALFGSPVPAELVLLHHFPVTGTLDSRRFSSAFEVLAEHVRLTLLLGFTALMTPEFSGSV